MGNILGSIFAALLGKILAWFKRNELEAAAAMAEELRQHAASVQAADAAESDAALAVQASEEASSHVTDLHDQLTALHDWNARGARSRIISRGIKRFNRK